MRAAALPPQELQRLAALHSYAVLDTPAESCFDDLVKLAAFICQTPMAMVSLVDGERQWFKSRLGLDQQEMERHLSFCAHAILQSDQIFEVCDASSDPRFCGNPLVTAEPCICFYAGMPLVTSDGHALGTLCVLDHVARTLTAEQRDALQILGRQVMAQLELRQRATRHELAELHAAQLSLKTTFDAIADLIWQTDAQGRVQACNPVMERLLNRPQSSILGQLESELFDSEAFEALRRHDEQVMASSLPVIRDHWLNFADSGTSVLFEVVKSPMVDADGDLVGVLSVARDVTERKAAQDKLSRLSKLYAALSQCNQAIVRCRTQDELFAQVCRDSVNFGGMKMAWIGLLDSGTECVTVAASFGEGSQDYLHDIVVSADPAHPQGRGPVGAAIRSGQPVWCQDFQADPRTAPWRKKGPSPAWASSAALPLARSGQTVGTFNLYADQVHAFDEATRNLLIEMAGDISFALGNFERDAARLRAEDALRLTRISVEAASDAMFWTTPDGRIVDTNEAACRSVGYSRAELMGMAMFEFDLSCSAQSCHSRFETLRAKGTLTYESLHRTKDGRDFPVEVVANYVKFGDLERNCAFVRDVTAQKENQTRIEQLAHFDALTGLPNRVLLNDRIHHALSMAQRGHTALSVLLVDLDHFKSVNDTLGHGLGDELLVELAARLKLAIRDEDTVARLGGDEFLLLLPGNDAAAAAHVADKLLVILSAPVKLAQHEMVVTGSIGIAVYPNDGTDFETLSKHADVAMYRAKQEGRNSYRFFTPEMQASSVRTLLLENALRQALTRGQLSLHYQPQMSFESGRIVGVEALLRWQHPELGSISPAEFIPIAESNGQILWIGEWVLGQALFQLKRWIDDGLAPITMAVNLSAVQFRHPHLPELVTRLLAESGVPARLLELELTESVTLKDTSGAIAVMDDLHARGVTLAIDDFGTGYSSLGHLKRFKVGKLKIDKSFVHDIATDADDRAIVGAIISLAQILGIQTIAEGVETDEQSQFMQDRGCDQMQGYYLSQPVPPEQAFALMRSQYLM